MLTLARVAVKVAAPTARHAFAQQLREKFGLGHLEDKSLVRRLPRREGVHEFTRVFSHSEATSWAESWPPDREVKVEFGSLWIVYTLSNLSRSQLDYAFV
jgi:hypothetical protein